MRFNQPVSITSLLIVTLSLATATIGISETLPNDIEANRPGQTTPAFEFDSSTVKPDHLGHKANRNFTLTE